MAQSFDVGDQVRFRAYTPQAAGEDYATGTVLAKCDSPLVGEWVDIAFGKNIRRGVQTGWIELVRRPSGRDADWTDDHDAADQARAWPVD